MSVEKIENINQMAKFTAMALAAGAKVIANIPDELERELHNVKLEEFMNEKGRKIDLNKYKVWEHKLNG